jgi:kynurenine formamidase
MNRWKFRPEGANWGEFGPDDQRGRLNLITPEVVRRAVAEVKEGRVFCLSLPLDLPGGRGLNPRRFAPRIDFSMRGDDPVINYPMCCVMPGQTDVVNDDRVTLSTQYSTQWDSLAHFGAIFDADGDGKAEIVYYNGYRAGEHIRGPFDYLNSRAAQPGPYGAHALGIENMATAGVQSRGVMIDVQAHFGTEWRGIDYDDLMHIIKVDRVEVLPGDILCVRTGFDRALMDYAGNPPEGMSTKIGAGLDGSDDRLLQWIDTSGIAAIAADTEGVELLPAKRPGKSGTHVPLHEHCLVKLGIHLGELFHLSELADWLRANQRTAFLLTAPPLRLPGAVGSPVTPIATV